MRDRCGTCKWYQGHPATGGGLCKLNPPQALAVKGTEPEAQMQVMPLYPPVQDDDGCQHHAMALATVHQ